MLSLLYDQPLALTWGVVEAIRTADEATLRAMAARARPDSLEGAEGGVIAVLPVYGPISQRPDMFTAFFGGTSLAGLTARFRAAMADPAIKAIVFEHDSPGGTAYGVPELAREIREARGSKPIVSMVNSLSASADYWLAAQADKVVATPSGAVGSVGVYLIHVNEGPAAEKAGVQISVVTAGGMKGDATGLEALTEEGRAAMQARVDHVYGMFVADLAKGRGVSPETVRSSFGRGAIVTPPAAKEAGMIDRIDTLDGVLRTLSSPAGRRSMMKAAEGAELAYDGEAERRLRSMKVRGA
jgi:signal peptide peptidase SppA